MRTKSLYRLGIALVVIPLFLTGTIPSQAQTLPYPIYDMGSPTLTDLYVDPVNGSDDHPGTNPDQALQSVSAAWNMIPMGAELATGYHLWLAPGDYSQDIVPTYWEQRYGTAEFPIILEAMDGAGTVTLPAINIFDTTYFYLINLTISQGGGDVLHCEQCDTILVRGVTVVGADPETYDVQEVVKFNQSQRIYIEDSDFSGGWDNALDFVGVQYGHVVNSRIHNAGDWCLYLKGGSAYFDVMHNEFFDCGTGGFSAGQGTGFEFMVTPWLQYEAYGIRFINNIVHDTQGAGAGVNGGYNILIAHNTFYRVGERSHGLEVVFGLRTCDGNTERCAEYLEFGGWGTTITGGEEPIPNRNVFLYNNLLYNPPGFQSPWQHFAIYAPRTPSPNSNIPAPAVTDDNLQIVSNVIWNGPAQLPIGIESDAGCQPENPTCNLEQLRRDNLINMVEPQLADPQNGDFALTAEVGIVSELPDFAWDLQGIPAWESDHSGLRLPQVGAHWE